MIELPRPTLVSAVPGGPSRRRDHRWRPVALDRAAFEHAVDDLLRDDRGGEGLRRVLLVHPDAPAGATGLAPGIQVAIEVLAPGETAVEPRRNSAGLALHLSGRSEVVLDGRRHEVDARDIYSVPPWVTQTHTATGTEPSVRVLFSNAALLDLLGAHREEPVTDSTASRTAPEAGDAPEDDLSVRNNGRVAPLGDAWRLEYERLVDPPWVPFRTWLWRWRDIEAELDRMKVLTDKYDGRRVCVLHDPTTGRTNGTTSTLFASMCIRPAGIIDRPHRHTAAAVNYFLDGDGWSTIDGDRIEWSAGDLVFIAPSWLVHHHASGTRDVQQLAVQDNPLHLAMGSLVWQEDLTLPPRLLGAEEGFTTNRHTIGTAT